MILLEKGVKMLLKKGSLAKTEKGELAIVDENNQAYGVDNSIIAIWNKCDGEKTNEQIVDEVSKEANLEKEKVSDAVSTILSRLEQAGLVQKV